MLRTAVVLSLVLASATAAAVAALRAPRKPPAPAADPPAAIAREGGLRLSARLDRRWVDARGGASYLEIGVAADGVPERGPRTAVNAVLIVDRSGSMSGEKIARARDAARALIAELDGEDRLAIVDFASDAHLLLPSAAVTPALKEIALAQVARQRDFLEGGRDRGGGKQEVRIAGEVDDRQPILAVQLRDQRPRGVAGARDLLPRHRARAVDDQDGVDGRARSPLGRPVGRDADLQIRRSSARIDPAPIEPRREPQPALASDRRGWIGGRSGRLAGSAQGGDGGCGSGGEDER